MWWYYLAAIVMLALNIKWMIDDYRKGSYFGTGLWVAFAVMHATAIVMGSIRLFGRLLGDLI